MIALLSITFFLLQLMAIVTAGEEERVGVCDIADAVAHCAFVGDAVTLLALRQLVEGGTLEDNVRFVHLGGEGGGGHDETQPAAEKRAANEGGDGGSLRRRQQVAADSPTPTASVTSSTTESPTPSLEASKDPLPAQHASGGGLGTGEVVGIVVGSIVGVLVFIVVAFNVARCRDADAKGDGGDGNGANAGSRPAAGLPRHHWYSNSDNESVREEDVVQESVQFSLTQLAKPEEEVRPTLFCAFCCHGCVCVFARADGCVCVGFCCVCVSVSE